MFRVGVRESNLKKSRLKTPAVLLPFWPPTIASCRDAFGKFGFCGTATGSRPNERNGPWRSLHVLGIDGFGGTLDDVLRNMREIRPKQVMLETCAQRRLLAERGQAIETVGADGDAGDSAPQKKPLSHTDAIAIVHGGLRGGDIAMLTRTADEVGAQVYVVDRPYQASQNLVAKYLLFRPLELLAFARNAVASLSGSACEKEQQSMHLHELLVGQRERHIAKEVVRRAVSDSDVFVVCRGGREQILRDMIISSAGHQRDFSRSSDDVTRVWPFLLVMVYVLIPGYASILCGWRLSRIAFSYLPGYRNVPADTDEGPGIVMPEVSAGSVREN